MIRECVNSRLLTRFQYISCVGSIFCISYCFVCFWRISIHLMCRFDQPSGIFLISSRLFQYISCVGSISYAVFLLLCYRISIHLMCRFDSSLKDLHLLENNFNTSHVSVRFFTNNNIAWCLSISIHLMCRFDKSQPFVLWENNRISIHLMCRFDCSLSVLNSRPWKTQKPSKNRHIGSDKRV